MVRDWEALVMAPEPALPDRYVSAGTGRPLEVLSQHLQPFLNLLTIRLHQAKRLRLVLRFAQPER